MFGDCQVLSSMGGNTIPSDKSIYSSSLQNPNFNFMSNINPLNIFSPIIPKEENGMAKSKEEIMESGSGSERIEGFSGDEQEAEQQQLAKKKRYHRHTGRQIQEMEGLFKECPHPDDKQRLKLSQELGLKPRQVKFWFQNRRTQMKAQQDRQDNVVLRAENENLKNENYRLQSASRNIVCPNCGGPAILGEMGYDEQQLRIDNARLKEEFERICCFVSQSTGRSLQSLGPTPLLPSPLDIEICEYPRKFDQQHMSYCPLPDTVPLPFMPENFHFSANALILEEEKSLAVELAMSSMDELVKMCHTGEPLWIRATEMAKEVMNLEEYARMFSWSGNLKQHCDEFMVEATRDTAVVIMNSITLVDAFLDVKISSVSNVEQTVFFIQFEGPEENKWVELFPSIISRAKTLQVVHPGVSGHASGSLHLMYAELQVLSPLIPTRETHFLRYCQHNAEEGTWVIVDFSLDGFHNSYPTSFPCYKKCPSGCIIEDMPNGYSRVTWVEHAEVEDGPIHQVFNHQVGSGTAFGAHRWLAVLQRQCERLASLMARNISDLGVIPSSNARKNLMYLAQRMIRTFCLNISTSCGQSWTALSDSADDTVRITTRKVVDHPGQPNGLILSAVSTTWLPYQHNQVFDFLRDERRRAQLEVLSNGNSLHEVAHIANGSHPGNCISLLRINVASNSSQSVELVLLESCSDDSGSMVVYTTIEVEAVQLVMSCDQDPSCIPLLPLGFIITPMDNIIEDPITNKANTKHVSETEQLPNNPGCLLTVGLQVLASTTPSAKLNLSSVTAINHHLCNTVIQINDALSNGNGDSNATGNFTENGNVLAPNIDAPPDIAVKKKSSGSSS